MVFVIYSQYLFDLMNIDNYYLKLSNLKFYYLKNEAVLLEQAMILYALDVLCADGFTPIATPDLAREEILSGIGFNPRGEETQIYSIEKSDLCLIATAEITGLYSRGDR